MNWQLEMSRIVKIFTLGWWQKHFVAGVVLFFGVLGSFSMPIAIAQTPQSQTFSREEIRAYVHNALRPGANIRKWKGEINFAVIGSPMERFWPQIDALVAAASRASGLQINHVKVPTGGDLSNLHANVLFILTDQMEVWLRSSFFEPILRQPGEEVNAYLKRMLAETADGASFNFTASERESVGGPNLPRFRCVMSQVPRSSERLPTLFEMNFMEIFFESNTTASKIPTVFRVVEGPNAPPARITDLDWNLLKAVYDPRIPFDVPTDEIVHAVTEILFDNVSSNSSPRSGGANK
jgi:hypothetical protein